MELVIAVEARQSQNPRTVALVKRYLCISIALVLAYKDDATTCRNYSSIKGSLEPRYLLSDRNLRRHFDYFDDTLYSLKLNFNFTVKNFVFVLIFWFLLLFSSYLATSLNLRINLKDLSRAAHCGRMPPTVGDLLKTHESMSKLNLHVDACIQSASALLCALDAWLCLLAKISVGVEGEHCSNHLLREKALRAARRRR